MLLAVLGYWPGLGRQQLASIIVVQPINALSLLLIALRLSLLSNGTVGIWPAFKGTTLAATLLYVLPSRLSELIKPVYFAHRCGITMAKGLALIAVERLLDVIVVTIAILLGALLIATPGLGKALYLWGGLTLAGSIAVMVLLRWPHLLTRVLALLPAGRVLAMIEQVMAEVRQSIASRRFIGALLAGLGAWVASYLMVHTVLVLAGSITLAPTATFLVFLAGTVGLAAAVAPGGLGTFEAGTVVALKLHGYSLTEALGLALLLRLANLGFLPLLAASTLAKDGLGLAGLVARVRQIRRPDDA